MTPEEMAELQADRFIRHFGAVVLDAIRDVTAAGWPVDIDSDEITRMMDLVWGPGTVTAGVIKTSFMMIDGLAEVELDDLPIETTFDSFKESLTTALDEQGLDVTVQVLVAMILGAQVHVMLEEGQGRGKGTLNEVMAVCVAMMLKEMFDA